MEPIRTCYRIVPEGREEVVFDIALDPETLLPVEPAAVDLPHWTELKFHQCSNCPLSPQTHPHCPMATRLLPLVAQLGDIRSYENVQMSVETADRTINVATSAQEALSSLMGLFIATSGCPHTTVFKPMARFHLPMANPDETFYRVVSMYALAQYFRMRKGLTVRKDFEGLECNYEAINLVNRAMAKRLRMAGEEDSLVNAIILLDLLAQLVPASMREALDELERIFHGYLEN